MPKSPEPVTDATQPDVLDQLANIQPESALAELRTRRADVTRYTQGSYDALLAPAELAGVSKAERELIALRVAILNASTPLIQHYREQLAALDVPATTVAAVEHFPAGSGLTEREAAILHHVDLLTNEPRAATPQEVATLQAHGLSVRDIVTIAQLIAFLSFQVRTLVGLQLLAEAK
ncbi:MAG: CMD domain protein [Chloroflexi bacterium]|nr:CMD domain protein [Chloroflexota bacterium]